MAHMQSRLSWVDAAKGIGIILVVYGHVARGLVAAHLMPDDAVFRTVDSAIYSFHMPLFFFLSGIFFWRSLISKGPALLVSSKIDTIVWPYVLWSLLQGGIEYEMSKFTNSHVTLSSILAFPIEPRAQFWFLYALFIVSAVCAIIYYKCSPRYFSAMFALLALLYLCKGYLPVFRPLTYFAANSVFFAGGIWLGQNAEKIQALAGKALPPTLIVFTASHFLYQVLDIPGTLFERCMSLAIACVSILFVSIVSMRLQFNDRIGRWLRFIGEASMSIYLIHILAGSGTRIVLKSLGIESSIVHVIIGTVVGVVVPLLINEWMLKGKFKFLLALPYPVSFSRLAKSMASGKR
ncbi:acyltransferase [Stenotrophomonas sp.]|uniref:acyltransferase family protein n=1 Tax=Stenotrophomonas sp. TaxID=69392 RepID=UPI0028A738D9|nr:acyltransferase [Stenotrophomonas sp.]